MTDRIQSLFVELDRDMRDDAADVIAQAVLMVKGVKSVHLGPVVNDCDYMARNRVLRIAESKILDFFKDLRREVSEKE